MSDRVETYIRKYYPGSFIFNSNEVLVESRDIPTELDYECIAFCFVDKFRGSYSNQSNMYYIDGKVYSYDRVEREVPDNKILLSNMRINGWDNVVKVRSGAFQTFDEGDVVIEYHDVGGEDVLGKVTVLSHLPDELFENE